MHTFARDGLCARYLGGETFDSRLCWPRIGVSDDFDTEVRIISALLAAGSGHTFLYGTLTAFTVTVTPVVQSGHAWFDVAYARRVTSASLLLSGNVPDAVAGSLGMLLRDAAAVGYLADALGAALVELK